MGYLSSSTLGDVVHTKQMIIEETLEPAMQSSILDYKSLGRSLLAKRNNETLEVSLKDFETLGKKFKALGRHNKW